jgi:hypothetical protein
MYIVKLTNSKVELYDERGCYQRTIVHSNAVFADIDMTQTMIVVTFMNGKVELYNERGCYQRAIVHGNASQARWVGRDIAVTLNGHVEIYSDRGCYIRRI